MLLGLAVLSFSTVTLTVFLSTLAAVTLVDSRNSRPWASRARCRASAICLSANGAMVGSISTTVTLAPSRRPHAAQLEADRAGADDHQVLGHLGERERLGGRDDRARRRRA